MFQEILPNVPQFAPTVSPHSPPPPALDSIFSLIYLQRNILLLEPLFHAPLPLRLEKYCKSSARNLTAITSYYFGFTSSTGMTCSMRSLTPNTRRSFKATNRRISFILQQYTSGLMKEFSNNTVPVKRSTNLLDSV